VAWERRVSRSYFYRSVRTPNGPRRIYCGSGRIGEAYARIEDVRKRERIAAKMAGFNRRAMLESAHRELQVASELMQLLVAARLLLAGFHRDHRRWRAWRHKR